jgi:hypothetical protein
MPWEKDRLSSNVPRLRCEDALWLVGLMILSSGLRPVACDGSAAQTGQ